MSPDLSISRSLIAALTTAVAFVLSPPRCAACDALLPHRAVFCTTCASTVEPALFLPPDRIAFASFRGPIADALRRFKYRGRADLAEPLGQLACRAANDAGLEAELVVPVPLHPRRLAERGYNQAALLGAVLAPLLGARLCARALRRVRDTPQQAKLDREARLANMARAFSVRAPAEVRGRRIALIDDVITTGATINTCRGALLDAGAASVVMISVASAEMPQDNREHRVMALA